MSFGLFDFNETSTRLETFNEFNTFSNSISSTIMFNTQLFIKSLSFISFSGSFSNSSFSISNELFINCNQVFELSSLWVEGILEMCSCNSESYLGISKSGIDFFVKFEMFSLSPPIFFLFTL